jgi:AraC-like DNA-binding protein
MTITLSEQALYELFEETLEPLHHDDPNDKFDRIYKYPEIIGGGYWRFIELREGLSLEIGSLKMHDRTVIRHSEDEIDYLELHFHFSGIHQNNYTNPNKYDCIGSKQYGLYGCGLFPQQTTDCAETQPYLEVIVYMRSQTLQSFIGDSQGQLSKELQDLVRPVDREQYYRVDRASLPMQQVAQQILHCPYRGIAKRMYLESKALELMSIAVAKEIESKERISIPKAIKSNFVDRIHQARDILLQRLDNPPSVIELAQQVGLNTRSLKQGFRQVFGQPTFSYLHDYRLEQARQLLETNEMKVTEVAKAVGFANRSYFAEAFRKKFGFNPKHYQLQQKKFF